MSFLNKNILIIGGSGFIGSHLCATAISKGMNVTNISLKNKVKGATNYKINISSKESFNSNIRGKKFDYIINCGGYIDHSDFNQGGDKVINDHLGGVYNILKLLDLSELNRLIQIGSSDEYGLIDAPQSEKDTCFPISPYSYSKYSASKFLEMLGKKNNHKFTIIRLFLVYGPSQKKNRLIPYIINSFLENKIVKLSPGDQLRDFTFIDDIVKGIFLCLNQKDTLNGEIINLCSSNPVSLKAIVELLSKIMKSDLPKFGQLDYRENENMELWGSNEKAKRLLDWTPEVTLDEGLKRTVKSYLKTYYGK